MSKQPVHAHCARNRLRNRGHESLNAALRPLSPGTGCLTLHVLSTDIHENMCLTSYTHGGPKCCYQSNDDILFTQMRHNEPPKNTRFHRSILRQDRFHPRASHADKRRMMSKRQPRRPEVGTAGATSSRSRWDRRDGSPCLGLERLCLSMSTTKRPNTGAPHPE